MREKRILLRVTGANYKVGSLGKKKLSIQGRICAYISYAESAMPALGRSKSS